MSKKMGIAALVLSLVALCLGIVSLALTAKPAQPVPTPQVQDGDIQYVLYVGTNDKDTNEPVGTPEQIKARVDQVLSGFFGGFTIMEANGGWVGDDGTVYHEYTVVVDLSDTDLETVHKACDALIREFNQSSILIQANRTTTEFYSG